MIQMFPIILALIPLFILFKNLGLINTYFSVIIIYTVAQLPFATWMFRSFFDSIPIDLEEAAQIDGCSRLQAFRFVVLPLCSAAFAAVTIFAFLFNYNEYLIANIFLRSEGTMTDPRGHPDVYAAVRHRYRQPDGRGHARHDSDLYHVFVCPKVHALHGRWRRSKGLIPVRRFEESYGSTSCGYRRLWRSGADYSPAEPLPAAGQVSCDSLMRCESNRARWRRRRCGMCRNAICTIKTWSPTPMWTSCWWPTRNAYHADVTIAAAASGKHVLVEKPAALNFAEADAMLAAQARAGVVVQVAYMRRYAPAFEQACQIVAKMQAQRDIRLARVHDVIGHNAQIIEPTSRVIKGKDIAKETIAEAKKLNDAAVAIAIGDVPDEVQNAYSLMLGLSSHDISAMRELLGMPSASCTPPSAAAST